MRKAHSLFFVKEYGGRNFLFLLDKIPHLG
jgi:hypothetical protein